MLTPADIRALPPGALARALYDAGYAPEDVILYHSTQRLWLTVHEDCIAWDPATRLDQAIGLLEAIQAAGWTWRMTYAPLAQLGLIEAEHESLHPTQAPLRCHWTGHPPLEYGATTITDTQASAICRLRLLWEVGRRGG